MHRVYKSKGSELFNWTFLDESGNRVTVSLTGLYVPAASSRLLPPQQLSVRDDTCQANGAWIGFGKDALVFYQGHCIRFPYHTASNLPIGKLAPGISRYQAFQCSITHSSPPVAQSTDNLSSASRKLLRLHHRLGHKGFTEIQRWAAEGTHNIPSDVAGCPVPMCRACQYGAAKKRPHETTNTGSVIGTPAGPGDFVSVDQMIAGSPGLIPFTSGRPSHRRYKSVTLWVDHFSRFLHAHCQEDATIQSALESKEAFETFAKRYNVRVKHVHSDNGVFETKKFRDHLDACNQRISLCGVGAHWQNGVIERYIGIITTRARTMLLHAMEMWPDVITSEF